MTNNNDRVYYSHDAEIQAKRERAVSKIFSLAFGLGIGVVLALFLAPTSGKKARHNLAQSMSENLENGHDAIGPMVKQIEEKFGEMLKNVEKRIAQMT